METLLLWYFTAAFDDFCVCVTCWHADVLVQQPAQNKQVHLRMLCYQEVQVVQEVREDRQWSKQNHILRMSRGVPEALAAQEGRLVLVYHSLGYLVNLALRGGLGDQALTLLWVPEMCQD